MIRRPTDTWRAHVADFAAPYPEPFVAAAERVLTSFEAEVRRFGSPSDDEVLAAIRRVVEGLNAVDGTHDHDFDTVEREELCEFIDDVLTEAGIDLDGLAARRGIKRFELTDEWRDW
ncbi:hypothetical protein [Nonomuraea harbinensis]|uniref:Uncharacterized protein n=1 Tax=Nonomuraea harbinensis TaxID=1286938 RepID=A0ABW1C4U5_9ACTN|nr:hypothetical protein [Nonomuraea harbinensis]